MRDMYIILLWIYFEFVEYCGKDKSNCINFVYELCEEDLNINGIKI